MKLLTILGILLLAVAVLWVGCESDKASSVVAGKRGTFLGHVNHGCSGSSRDISYAWDEAYLNGYEFDGTTLTLDIHFTGNCCPGFVEEASFEDDHIHIAVLDTLYGCRCHCPYDNEFLFLCDEGGDLEISFQSIKADVGLCISSFDTLITVVR
jgi:hypothetical protein